MKVWLRLLIIPAVLTAVLSSMIFERMNLLETGTLVELKTIPIDPRSLFRGDYVILSYPMSRIDIYNRPGDHNFKRGDNIYLTLSSTTGEWLADKAHKHFPDVADNTIVIAGRVQHSYKTSCDDVQAKPDNTCTKSERVSIKYGIESFFVPENEGRSIERERNAGKVSVTVAIDARGKAGLKSLQIDGETVHSESLF